MPAPSLLVKVLVVTELETPSLMAMAFTVVVALRVTAELYCVLELVGVEPSVV